MKKDNHRKMEKRFNLSPATFIAAFGIFFCLGSCAPTQDAVYFNNLPASTDVRSTNIPVQRITPNDILSITVSSLSPEASAVFNTPINPINVTQNNLQLTGYLVDAEGNIQFPILGKIKAGGLTTAELTEQIRNLLLQRDLLKGPVVATRFLNFRVTVLGEVNNPTVINVPNEKISILEAVGMAGDLTLYARRDNVLLIREENDQKIMRRINLNSQDIFTSPYYYLKSNDIIYAEPNKTKIASTTNTRQLLPVILSGLSFLAIIVDRVTR